MSAKSQFFQKLEATRQPPPPPKNKGQADIAAFRLQMEQMYENIQQWLDGSDLSITSRDIPIVELLLGNSSFLVTEITVILDNRSLNFTPLYLYGQGVTGCTEVSLTLQGQQSVLYRLFMRSGNAIGWTFSQMNTLDSKERAFDEESFFGMLNHLLP